MNEGLSPKVLLITSEWPSPDFPHVTPFMLRQVESLRSLGISVNVFHFRGKGNLLNYLRAWINIRTSPFWQKADILHAHWGQSAFVCLFSKKPLVITYHGSDLQGYVNRNGMVSVRSRLLVLFSRWISKQAKKIIVVSEHMKPLLPVSNHSIYVIPMGIDLSVFKPLNQGDCRQSLSLDLDKKFIIFASDPARPEKRYALARQATEARAG